MKAACLADEGAGSEMFEGEGVVIEHAVGFGIGGEQDLEAAIETEALNEVSAHAAAGGVGGLEQLHAHASGGEIAGASEACETSSDDDSVGVGGWCSESLGL